MPKPDPVSVSTGPAKVRSRSRARTDEARRRYLVTYTDGRQRRVVPTAEGLEELVAQAKRKGSKVRSVEEIVPTPVRAVVTLSDGSRQTIRDRDVLARIGAALKEGK